MVEKSNGIIKNIRIEQFVDEDCEKAAKLLTASFCFFTPIFKYLGFTEQEIMPLAMILCEAALRDDLSLVAKMNEDIIGCSISESLNNPFDLNHDKTGKFGSYLLLLEELSSAYSVSDNIVRWNTIAVDRFYQRLGIGSKLFLDTQSLFKTKGYKKFIIEAVHPYSWKIVENHCPDAKRFNTIKYSDFTLENGEKPFQFLSGEAIFGEASVI